MIGDCILSRVEGSVNKQSLTSEPTSVWRQSELYSDYRLHC